MIETDQLNLGTLKVHWLDKSVPLSESLVFLTTEELKKADTIKAAPRRHEFIRSRQLLRYLTNAKTSFLPDAENSPMWPPGMCGSITHKNGHVGVCTTSRDSYLSVGIDAECAEKDISHLREKICSSKELIWIDDLIKQTGMTDGAIIALIFSAKEALFKCHFPVGRKMFWFHDAEVVHIDFENSDIKIKVLVDTSPVTLKNHCTNGKFLLRHASDGRYWITAFALPK